jgi:integrase
MTDCVHFVRTARAAGDHRWYIYAWRGGPRIAVVDGGPRPRLSREMEQAVQAARDEAAQLGSETIGGLIRDWRRSPEWAKLEPTTRNTWTTGLVRIEDKWGETPLALWNDPRMVGRAVAWRDSHSDTPRAADIGVTVLSRLLEWGRLRARVAVNVAAGIPNLYHGSDRASIIWTAEDIDAFCRSALMLDRAHVIDGLFLAAFTGMRRADLVGVRFAECGEHAVIRTARKKSKGRRRRAVIPVLPELAVLIEELRGRPRAAAAETLLVTSQGRPWGSPTTFGQSFALIREHAGIIEPGNPELGIPDRAKHLHDLRGTFVTLLCRAGLTDEEIAGIVAWSPHNVGEIRRTYVDDAAVVVALGRRIRAGL